MFRAQLRAISPVIATIIIVAVTIAIAVAVAGWLMGLWTGYTAKPVLEIVDANFIVGNESGKLNVTVYNDGSATAKIVHIRLSGVECSIKGYYENGQFKQVSNNEVTIAPKETKTITATCSGTWTPGASYQVVVIDASGVKAVTQVIAK